MNVLSKVHNIQLVKIKPEERLAATSELNLAPCLVTGCGEARGMGYWTATQVKGLSPENKTGLITYPVNDSGILLKNQMRENLKSSSVRGLIAASGRRWL